MTIEDLFTVILCGGIVFGILLFIAISYFTGEKK